MQRSVVTCSFMAILAGSVVAHAQEGAPAGPGAEVPAPDAESTDEERTALNTIYVELLGPGLFYSINYDRTFDDFAARVGFSYFSVGVSASGAGGGASSSASFMTFPITVSYLGIGSKKHMFEVGAGVTFLSLEAGASVFGAEGSDSASASALIVAPTGILGYRMQPADGGFFLHAGLAPMLFLGGRESAVWPAPYFGIGGTF